MHEVKTVELFCKHHLASIMGLHCRCPADMCPFKLLITAQHECVKWESLFGKEKKMSHKALAVAAEILGGHNGEVARLDRDLVQAIECVDALSRRVGRALTDPQVIATIIWVKEQHGGTLYHTGG